MKKLSGKDVMVGDFVQRPGYGIGVVFECSNTHLLVDFNGKSEHIEWCEGVPLTADIIDYIKSKYEICKARFLCEWRDDTPSENSLYYVSISNEDETTLFIGSIKYAHELQHALSAVGYIQGNRNEVAICIPISAKGKDKQE